MTDILVLQERCRNTIQLGESHFREFKSALEGREGHKKPRLAKKICQDIAEALVSFANADGGELLVGVEDDRTITGVPHDADDVTSMFAATTTHVLANSNLPITIAERIELEGKLVLYFSIAKSTTKVYQLADGRCVRRKDRSTLPESFQKIQFDRQEIRSREYDQQFVDGATVNDIDTTLVQSIADNYLSGLSVERYLQQAGLAEYSGGILRLRMAALLLFARNIQNWHPRSQVRILKVAGTSLGSGENYNVTFDSKPVTGNIFELLRLSWERLGPLLADRTEFGGDARFEQHYIYPEKACREALVNALAHRDYGPNSGIDIFIYNDRLEIKSPGPLLSSLTVSGLQELKGEHESRNPLVARVLNENKYMRELGEGIKRIFEAIETNEQQAPKLVSNGSSFTIVFFHSSVFDSRQQRWLELFRDAKLTRRQRKIVVLGMDARPLSPADIYKAMNTADRDTYDREVTSLRKGGVLEEMTTNVGASKISKEKNIPKREVPRFKVIVPQGRAR